MRLDCAPVDAQAANGWVGLPSGGGPLPSAECCLLDDAGWRQMVMAGISQVPVAHIFARRPLPSYLCSTLQFLSRQASKRRMRIIYSLHPLPSMQLLLRDTVLFS